jgi:hypothetical protein
VIAVGNTRLEVAWSQEVSTDDIRAQCRASDGGCAHSRSSAPDLAPYFVMSAHDDPAGMRVTQATPPNLSIWRFIAASTPFLVTVLNAVVAAAVAAVVMLRTGALPAVVLGVAVLAFLLLLAIQATVAQRNMTRLQAELHPMFPSPALHDRPGA